MAKTWPPKDPQERLDYTVEWADRLTSETISLSTWTITGPDSLLLTDSNSISGTQTVIWLTGGTLNGTYYVLNHITTSAGRQMEQTVRLKIKSK